MSRAASWQVLNQGFANLNNAMATIMRNKEAQRRMDLYEQFGNLDRAFRAQQAAQAQANADRAFNYGIERDAQSQKNWESDYNQKADMAKAAQEQRNIQNLIKIADQYGGDVANAYDAAQRGDPIARNMLIAGIGEAKKNAQLQDDYRNLLNHKRALELVEARKAGDGQVTENPQSNTGNLIKNLSNLNKNLDSWYWTSAGRQEDENKKNLTIYNIAQNINSVDALREFTQSKILSEQDAQQIAKIKGWIK